MNSTLDSSGAELVGLAEQEVRRLANISRQTLAPHRQTKFPVVTKLSELLDDVCAVYRPRLQSSKIKVERNYQIEGEVTIYPSELRQVFTNLITNAIDAIGQQGQLYLAIEKAPENQVVVHVRDSGCGIPEENLKTIFQPFFTTKGDKGTGIGLWVIKGIVDKLGGKIEVETSTTGTTGTCFSIFLPGHWGNGTGESTRSVEDVQAVSSRPA